MYLVIAQSVHTVLQFSFVNPRRDLQCAWAEQIQAQFLRASKSQLTIRLTGQKGCSIGVRHRKDQCQGLHPMVIPMHFKTYCLAVCFISFK